MDIIRDVRGTTAEYPHVVLTIGSFDGLHLGHRSIVEDVVRNAKEMQGTAAVLTMDPHPREFFSTEHAPNLLTCLKKKLSILEELGIDVAFVLRFDREVADLEPLRFVEEIIHDRCHAEMLVVGHDCRFGKGAQGDFQLLERVGPSQGFTVKQLPPLIVQAERVSSTLIRERVLQGDLEGIEVLLGRKYSVQGEVVKGRGVGSQIGFATANVQPLHSAVPAQGVYIAEVLMEGRSHPAAVNIGIAPTIRHDDVTIEAHILDFSEDVLGREIEVVFHRRIRSEKKFPNREALSAQIASDVGAVREYFGS